MNLFAISDLHISTNNDPMYFSLIAILDQRVGAGDVVVLAGDIFDLFIGSKDVFVQKYARLLEAVKNAGSRGAQVYYIEGNHDFLMKQVFEGMKSVQLHAHSVKLEIAGKRFFFAHGDTANRLDYGYRALRFLFRSWFMKAFIFILPGKWIEWIGETSSKLSNQKSHSKGSYPQVPFNIEKVRRIYRSYAAEQIAKGMDFVVLGHCHDLDEMAFHVGERFGQYINIGYPRIHGSFISWSPGEPKIFREKLPTLS